MTCISKTTSGIGKAAAAIALIAGLFGCGADTGHRSGRRARVVAQREFDSFADYLAAADEMPSAHHQVVVIGIDGATWNWIDPMIQEGLLPNFERMKREGASGPLESVRCYVSPPAWASLNTGYSPEKTGVYTFGKWDSDAAEFGSVRSTDIEVPAVWDVASAAGRRVGVVNVPMTFPVHAVNGIMVSGLMTPVTIDPPISVRLSPNFASIAFADVAPPRVRSYSPPRKTVAMDTLNTLMWFRIDSTDDGVENYDRVVLEVTSNDDARAGRPAATPLVFAVGEYSPWVAIRAVHDGQVKDARCKFKLFRRDDGRFEARISQTFFDPRERAPFTYPDTLADKLMSQFGYYLPSRYLPYDIVGNIARECSRQASYLYDYDDWDLYYYVFTQSDNIQHNQGLTDYTRGVFRTFDRFLGRMMDRLPQGSTLLVVSDHGFDGYELGVDLNRFFEESRLLFRRGGGHDVDYDRSLVFHNMWNLYFNEKRITREALDALGVTVAVGETPHDAFERHLGELCAGILTADGRRLPVTLEHFDGGRGDDDPDMIVKGTYNGYLVEFWNIARARDGVAWKLLDTEKHQHRRDGVFMAWGSGVAPGVTIAPSRVVDVAPTILYLLGLPAADDMDGRVIASAFRAELLASRPECVVPDFSEVPRTHAAVLHDDEPLEKKLRSLGYVH